jgi:hypothetical protein
VPIYNSGKTGTDEELGNVSGGVHDCACHVSVLHFNKSWIMNPPVPMKMLAVGADGAAPLLWNGDAAVEPGSESSVAFTERCRRRVSVKYLPCPHYQHTPPRMSIFHH